LNLELPAGGQASGIEVWSSDSRKVVFAADQEEQGEFQLLLADVSGDELAAPLTVSERIKPGQSLCSWSPDNRWVVFTSDLVTPNTLELFAFDTTLTEGAAPVRLNTALAAQEHAVLNVAFAPQGARLYYSAEQASPGAYDLFTVDLSGAAPSAPLRLNTSSAAARSAIVSSIGRDGSLFFLESTADTQNLYWLTDASGEGAPVNAAMQKVSTFALAYP
jgi:Tol biopolymer transport system component